MSLAGFAGALVFARRAIVEQQQLCHFLTRPNIDNLSMLNRAGPA